ncbi:MAG: TraR/DksA family transcriptional regulator [Myxococcota bacterium]
MTPSEAAAVRDALLKARAELLAAGDVDVRVAREVPHASETDEDEAPHLEMDQSIASARNRERVERLAQIDDALKRLADDPEAYGLCDACDEPIAPRRLALLPFARLCVACQARHDADPHAGRRRKVTDYR